MGMWSTPKRAKLHEWLGSGQTSNGQFPLEVGPLLSACHGDSIRKIWGSCGAKDGVHLGSTQEPVLAMFESMKSGSQWFWAQLDSDFRNAPQNITPTSMAFPGMFDSWLWK